LYRNYRQYPAKALGSFNLKFLDANREFAELAYW
jgi:hypothetical protein